MQSEKVAASASLQPGQASDDSDVAIAQPESSPRLVCWLKRFGVLGFCFFLVKGLLWLTLPALVAYFAAR